MRIAFPSKARKKIPILDECFLELNLFNNSCFIPFSSGKQLKSERPARRPDRQGQTDAATALCARENKISFLVPEKKTIELKHQNQIRKSEPKSFLYFFSKIALIQHARQSDVTQNAATEIDLCCSLFIVNYVHVQRM